LSRDVIFDELAAWSWDDNEPQVIVAPSGVAIIPLADASLPTPRKTQNRIDGESSSAATSSDDSDSDFPYRYRSLTDICVVSNFVLLTGEPQNYKEAADQEVWRKAMNEEIRSIEKNQTWELVNLPERKDAIGLKWIFKMEYNEDESIQNYKTRVVTKGYSQQRGVDFNETFAPVAQMETIRIVLAFATQLEIKVYQLDIKSAFLNGELEEVVHVHQPKGYFVKGQEEKVYRLQKTLHGLKQAPRAWNSKINSYFQHLGLQRSPSDSSLYVKIGEKENFLIVCLYVDDVIYAEPI